MLSFTFILATAHRMVCGSEINDPSVLLVGEGLPFNSEGVCLRKSHELPEFTGSMAGAAVVVATMIANAKSSLPMNISAVIPLCGKVPSGKAFRPADIVTTLSGKTIIRCDTNNAGVLIIADALTYVQKALRPKLVVNIGTLSNEVHCRGVNTS